MPDNDHIIGVDAGRLLRAARARAGLTQRALAERSGIRQPAIAAIESGRQDPRYRTLEKLIRACGHDLDILRHGGEGVDRTQFRANLRLSPKERVKFVDSGAATMRLLRSARRIG